MVQSIFLKNRNIHSFIHCHLQYSTHQIQTMQAPPVSEINAIRFIADFVNYPSESSEFPEESLTKGPVVVFQALQKLFDNTRQNNSFTFEFFGVVKKNLTESFLNGLVCLGNLRRHYLNWVTPSERQNDSSSKRASVRNLRLFLKTDIKMARTLNDPNKLIPTNQNLNYRIIFVAIATLKTKPELIEAFADMNGFKMIVNLLTDEVSPSDALQDMFCRFVFFFQSDPFCVAQLNALGVISILVTMSTASESAQVRNLALGLIESLRDQMTPAMLKQSIQSDPFGSSSGKGVSVDKLVNSLFNDPQRETQGLTRHTILGLLNDAMAASEDAKAQLFDLKLLTKLVDLFVDLTRVNLKELIVQHRIAHKRPPNEGKDVDGRWHPESHPSGVWTLSSLMTVLGNAVAGGADRQEFFAQHFGNIVLPRLVEIILAFNDVDNFFLSESAVCFIYKLIARCPLAAQQAFESGTVAPLLPFCIRYLENLFSSKLKFSAGEMTACTMGMSAAIVALNSFETATVSDELEAMIHSLFQLAIRLIYFPSITNKLDLYQIANVIVFMNGSVLPRAGAGDRLKGLQRMLRYAMTCVPDRTGAPTTIPYLSVFRSIVCRKGLVVLAFARTESMMKALDECIKEHNRLLLAHLSENVQLIVNLTSDEQKALADIHRLVTSEPDIVELTTALAKQSIHGTDTDANVCKFCGSQGRVKACSGCELVSYCGRQCQLSDWKDHKVLCKASKSSR